MDELILALTPQPDLTAQARLRRLPALLRRLRAGMAAVGIPAEARDRFLVQWMQAQARLLDAGIAPDPADGRTGVEHGNDPHMNSASNEGHCTPFGQAASTR